MARQAQDGAGVDRELKGPRGKKLSRLVLTGFMGAGKSTVGPLLAEALGWRFLDLDSVIEAAHQKSVPEIFRDQGEAVFRQFEQQALAGIGREHRLVLALGGGALEHPDALPFLLNHEQTCLVFLDAPLTELLARIQPKNPSESDSMKADAIRPLLADPKRLEDRHRSRLAGYRAAHITVVTTGLLPEEVAARILERVQARWKIGEE